MTFTADTYGEDFLESGELDLYEEDPEHPCNIRLDSIAVPLFLNPNYSKTSKLVYIRLECQSRIF